MFSYSSYPYSFFLSRIIFLYHLQYFIRSYFYHIILRNLVRKSMGMVLCYSFLHKNSFKNCSHP